MTDTGETNRFQQLLRATRAGSRDAADALARLVSDDLRSLARARLAGRGDHLLDPTALVNEAYVRLLGRAGDWAGRRHFFFLAARAMQDIMAEEARRRAAAKRGGGWARVDLDDPTASAAAAPDELAALDEAMDQLGQDHPLCAEVVRLRFYAGLTHEEIAATLEIPLIRARREWAYAKAFLHRRLRGDGSGGGR